MQHLTSFTHPHLKIKILENLRQFLHICLAFCYDERFSHMWRHCNFIKHWLSFRLHHLRLFRSSTGIHSALLCKHPVLKLTGGQALVWGLLSSTWYQVILLRFAVLLWINIELLCIRKPCFIFKSFLKLCKQCSQAHYKGDYQFGLICTASKQLSKSGVWTLRLYQLLVTQELQ